MKRIAIIGANEQQDPLIRLAKQRGFEAHVFAWQTGGEIGETTADFFHPISARNEREILAECEALGVSAIVSIGSDVAALSAAFCAQRLGLTSSPYESVKTAVNKLRAKGVLKAALLPVAPYLEVGDAIPSSELLSLGFPLVVKPSFRSGGRGVRLVRGRDELYSALNEAREISFDGCAVVEKYIDGGTYSCECISYEGVHTPLGITKRCVRVLKDGSFTEYRHEMPAYLSLSLSKKINELSVRALTALGITNGASSVEFVTTADGEIFINEVTPTMYGDFIGTDLVSLSTGYDYLGMTLDIALGIAPDIKPKGDTVRASVDFIYSTADVKEGIEPDGLPSEPGRVRYGHYITRYPYKEIGGCPPLFLADKSFSYFENSISLNSEYTALAVALEAISADKVNIPYYAPAFVERAVAESGRAALKYRINENFLPASEPMEGAVLIANRSVGCIEYARSLASLGREVIIDNSMSFFTPPLMLRGVYNIYSPRKFFALADGAYLVGADLPKATLDVDISYERVMPLLKSLELGEREAYKQRVAAEAELLSVKRLMSSLTRAMLSKIDFEGEREKRARNTRILDEILHRVNLFPFEYSPSRPPLSYPLLVNENIRDALVSKKIYVPLMWRSLLSEEHLGTVEGEYARRLIHLPNHPWYSEEDMIYIANTVISLLF